MKRHKNTCWSVVVNFFSHCKPVHLLLGLLAVTDVKAMSPMGPFPYPLNGDSIPVGEGRYGNCITLRPTSHFEDHRGGGWPLFFTGSVSSHGAACLTVDRPNYFKETLESAGIWKQCEDMTHAEPKYDGTPYTGNVTFYRQGQSGEWNPSDDVLKCEVHYTLK